MAVRSYERSSSAGWSDGGLVDAAGGLLLDWDGCIALGDRPLPGAVRFLQAHQHRVAVLSNNSTARPEDFAAILARVGVRLPLERIVLAGVEALRHAARLGASDALVLGASPMKAYGRSLGLVLDSKAPDVVVLLRDTRLTYARLQRAIDALDRGAKLIVANPDRTHPGPAGRRVPETGALLAALQACLPGLAYDLIGKPEPMLFGRACEVLGIAPAEGLMIGDNPDTDIRGAEAAGLQSLLIGPSGERPLLDVW